MPDAEHQPRKEIHCTSPYKAHQVVLDWAERYLQEVSAKVSLPDPTVRAQGKDKLLEVVNLGI